MTARPSSRSTRSPSGSRARRRSVPSRRRRRLQAGSWQLQLRTARGRRLGRGQVVGRMLPRTRDEGPNPAPQLLRLWVRRVGPAPAGTRAMRLVLGTRATVGWPPASQALVGMGRGWPGSRRQRGWMRGPRRRPGPRPVQRGLAPPATRARRLTAQRAPLPQAARAACAYLARRGMAQLRQVPNSQTTREERALRVALVPTAEGLQGPRGSSSASTAPSATWAARPPSCGPPLRW
jgi:hypothetical protein